MTNKELEELAIKTLVRAITKTTSAEYQIAASKVLLEHLRNKKENNND